MNVFSAFNGAGMGRMALDELGVKPDMYFTSEVDKYAMQVSNHIHSDEIVLGDVRNIQGQQLPRIDLFMGGTPCQGFSFAGGQLAFDDPRSVLFFEFVRILLELKAVNPNIKFLLENVRMKKEHLDVISYALGVQPIMIDSALVSAQNRKRYYWTNIEGIEQPKDEGILLKDIIEENAPSHYELSKKAAQRVLTNPRSRSFRVSDGKSGALLANQAKQSTDSLNVIFDPSQYIIPFDKSLQIMGSEVKKRKIGYIRKLTPRECGRLQTVPEHTIDAMLASGVSDNQLYKIFGNGWTVKVITHFLRGLI